MKKWMLLFLALPIACAGRKPVTDAAGHAIKKAEEIAAGFLNARGLALDGLDAYFVSHMDIEGKGVISRWKKGKTEIFLKGLDQPSGIVVDPRRGLLFVNDGKTAKIFKIRKPELDPAKIDVPVQTRLGDVTFSLMNRRAYLTGEGECGVWAIDPKTNKLEETLPASTLQSLGVGVPTRIFPSTDGARLYVMMSGDKGSTLVSVELKKKDARVVGTYADATTLTGIDLGKNHLVISAIGGSPVRAALLPKFEDVRMDVPEGLLHQPTALVMDYTTAVILDQLPDGNSSHLVQIPFHFKN